MESSDLASKFHDYAVKLGELSDKTAKFRSASYERVAHQLESTKGKIDESKVDKLNLTDYMKQKVKDVLEGKSIEGKVKSSKSKSSKTRSRSRSKSPKSPKSSKDSKKSTKSDDDPALLSKLESFMGLGPEKAKELVKAGLKRINQLHTKKFQAMLPEETKIFMTMKPEQKIPHEHIAKLEPLIMEASTEPIKLTIVGSYRRNKPFSSDIDLMVVSEEESAIEILKSRLEEKLKIYPYSEGRDKLSMIIDTSDILESKHIYKIDAFRTDPADEIAMLIYATGSKEFNIVMRGKAKRMGYLLNQKGLFKDGKKIELDTEQDYFDILNMEYKEPEERI